MLPTLSEKYIRRTFKSTIFNSPFLHYYATGKKAGFSNPVKNRVLESISDIFSPLKYYIFLPVCKFIQPAGYSEEFSSKKVW